MSDAPPQRRPPPPIPLTLLTGFLGAGKTTLLNRLVRAPELARSVVIINEFGDVAVDHLLVEQAEGGLLTLSSGCICCTVRGDLIAMLEDLLRRRDNGRMPPFDRVIIETTGLAEAGPILNTIVMHPYFVLRYRIDGIVTVIDALHGAVTLDAHHEAVDQVAVADALVLTKTDLAPADTASLRTRLAALNPHAIILDAARGEASAAALLEASASGSRARSPDHDGAGHHHHDHDHHHDDGLSSVALVAEAPLSAQSVDIFLDLLRATQGDALLRIKGLVGLRDDPDRPIVIQGVQRMMHPARRLPAWPDADRGSRLVVIGRRLDSVAVEGLWAATVQGPAVDRPDAAALARPLADGGPGLF